MRIERLSLENWRNFKSVEATVGDRLLVVGANASGKSNLLDALRFLRDITAIGGGLQHALAVRGGLKHVRCLAARYNNRGRVGIKIQLRDADDRPSWVYELHFTAEQRGRHRPIVRQEIVRKNNQTIIERPDHDDEEDKERLTQTALEQVNMNREFRPIAEFLKGVRYLHLVPQIIRDPELSQGRINDPFGGDFLVSLAQTKKRTRESRLRRINTALRIAVPQLDELSLERDEAGKPHLAARYKHWREGPGAKQSERDLSDGTLRLIGLLWMIQEGSGKKGLVVLLEEPELSLHSDIVMQLPTILYRAARGKRSQFILSTHSTEMLKDPGLGLDEVIILKPGDEGTTAIPAYNIPDIEHLINDGGFNLAEILPSETAPEDVDRLARAF